MPDGYNVDIEQLRTHARNIDAVRARFEAVKAASSHIAQDDQAYGTLCGWISGVLESKHTRHTEAVAYVEKNLELVSMTLQVSADDYESVEDTNASGLRAAGELS
jgi:hypothetical protein